MKCARCNGTGEEPERELTDVQWAIIDQIQDLGDERERASSARTLAGTQARENVYTKIRELAETAQKAGIPKVAVSEALGVSRTQLHNILKR